MLELGQFHLQLTLVALGALGEDVEDQAGAVQHADIEALFQVALLGGGQRMIEDDDFELVVLHGQADLIRLAAADEVSGVGRRPLAGNGRNRLCSRGTREQRQLLDTGSKVALSEIYPD